MTTWRTSWMRCRKIWMALCQPASDNLFDVDKDSSQLSGKEADFFHQTTARLLFAAKRANRIYKLPLHIYVLGQVSSSTRPLQVNRGKILLTSGSGCTVLSSYCHAYGVSTHKCTLHLPHQKYQDMSDPTQTSKCLRDQADYKASWRLKI